MKRILFFCGLWIVVLLQAMPVRAAWRAREADLQTFIGYWAGDWDNLAQVKAQADLPGSRRNDPLRLMIRRVDLPAFGHDVYYAEWQKADASHAVQRQRFYAFDIDPASGRLRLALHIFPTDAAIRDRTAGAYDHPERLAALTPADMVGLEGCDILFTRDIDKGFYGEMVKGACAFPAPGDGQPIYSWTQMKIGPGVFAYHDGWFKPDGTLYRRLDPDWYVFKRTRPAGTREGRPQDR